MPKPETPPFKAREGKADVKSTVPQISKNAPTAKKKAKPKSSLTLKTSSAEPIS